MSPASFKNRGAMHSCSDTLTLYYLCSSSSYSFFFIYFFYFGLFLFLSGIKSHPFYKFLECDKRSTKNIRCDRPNILFTSVNEHCKTSRIKGKVSDSKGK